MQNPVSMTLISYFWSGADATNAPDQATTGELGAAADGASTGAVYHYNGTAWVDTGATVANLYGG